MFEGLTCVYKSNVDLFFYVIGSSHENEVRHCMASFVLGLYLLASGSLKFCFFIFYLIKYYYYQRTTITSLHICLDFGYGWLLKQTEHS